MLTTAHRKKRIMKEKTESMEVSEAEEPFPKRRSRSFYPVNFMQTEPVFPSTVEDKSEKERESEKERKRERKRESEKKRERKERPAEERKKLEKDCAQKMVLIVNPIGFCEN